MKGLFKKGPTARHEVIFALASAIVAVWKAVDTTKQYKADQAALTQKENHA